jgi:hypothetical protein
MKLRAPRCTDTSIQHVVIQRVCEGMARCDLSARQFASNTRLQKMKTARHVGAKFFQF